MKSAFPSWSAIKPAASSFISAIAVAPGNSAIIWVGHNDGSIYSTANGTAASPTWTPRNTGLPARYCGRIAINPFNPNKVYATFGGYNTGNVWRTTDGGVTWTDISGNLPTASVNSLVIAPGVTNTLYVGTDVGIFGTTTDGGTWSTGNDGPANVATDELFWMANKLVAVTHGRGMFSITPALDGVNFVAAGSAVLGGNGNLQFFSGDNTYNNICLPYPGFNYAICPFWDDLRTDGTGSGIFTSISGSAPNRIFNIEWRAAYFSTQAAVNFEVRLYEGQPRFDMIYGTLNGTGNSATVGAQSDTGSAFVNYECSAGGLSPGLQLTFQPSCTDGGGVCPAGPAVNFTASPTSGSAPLTVFFTNLTSGATNYAWDFGDGHTSAATNPANAYLLAGSYTVKLSASGGGLTNSLTRTGYIVATNPPPLILRPAKTSTNFVFFFATLSGKTYTVQYKNALDNSPWQTAQVYAGNGATNQFTAPILPTGERFYRLSVQ